MILDTHAWLWFATDDKKLPKRIKSKIESSFDSCYISSISIWEACLLASRGKISIKSENPTQGLRQLLKDIPFKVAPITEEIVLLSQELTFKHRDPADHFIAATSKAYELPLVTLDKDLKGLKWLRTVS